MAVLNGIYTREQARKILDSVARMALGMLAAGEEERIVGAMVYTAKYDVESHTAEVNLPKITLGAVQKILQFMDQKEAGECRKFLEKYLNGVIFGRLFEPLRKEKRAPANWWSIALPYSCGWKQGEDNERAREEIEKACQRIRKVS